MDTFTGFPLAALDFYEDLEADNSKAFWTARKRTYDEAVRAPMTALVAELEAEFGQAKIFRPYRDVRFSAPEVDVMAGSTSARFDGTAPLANTFLPSPITTGYTHNES